MDYVIPVLGGRRLDSLTPHDLDKLYAALLVSGRKQAPYGRLSAAQRPLYPHVLRKALSDAVRKGTLARNVAEPRTHRRAKDTEGAGNGVVEPGELRPFLDLTAPEALGPSVQGGGHDRDAPRRSVRFAVVRRRPGRRRIEVRQQLLIVRTPGAANGGRLFSERTKTDRGRRSVDLDADDGCRAPDSAEAPEGTPARYGRRMEDEHDLVFTGA